MCSLFCTLSSQLSRYFTKYPPTTVHNKVHSTMNYICINTNYILLAFHQNHGKMLLNLAVSFFQTASSFNQKLYVMHGYNSRHSGTRKLEVRIYSLRYNLFMKSVTNDIKIVILASDKWIMVIPFTLKLLN